MASQSRFRSRSGRRARKTHRRKPRQRRQPEVFVPKCGCTCKIKPPATTIPFGAVAKSPAPIPTAAKPSRAILDQFRNRPRVRRWYDPLNPTVAVLVRGYSWFAWLLLLVPSGFILIGGGGLMYTLWHWGKSAEHRAVRGQLGRLDLFEEVAPRHQRVPHRAAR